LNWQITKIILKRVAFVQLANIFVSNLVPKRYQTMSICTMTLENVCKIYPRRWHLNGNSYSTRHIHLSQLFRYKKSLKIPKGQSESVYRRRTDNTMAQKKVQNDKQRSTKHTYKTKDRVTWTPLKNGGELRCSGRVSSSCSTSDTRRDNLLTNPVISHERGKEREVPRTSGTYPWSFVTQIYHNGQPSRSGDRKTFEVMTWT